MSADELRALQADQAQPSAAAPAKKTAAKKTAKPAAKKPASKAKAEDQLKPETAQPDTGPVLVPVEIPPGFVAMCAGIVGGIGGAICTRSKTDKMSPDEIQAIARPLAELAVLYDIGPKSQKGAAWLALGGALGGAIFARAKLPEKTDDAPGEAKNGPADAKKPEPGKPGKVVKGKDPEPQNLADPAPLVQAQSYAGS